MFDKIDKDKVNETNNKVNHEMNSPKPGSEMNKENVKKVAGRVLSDLGLLGMVTGIVGACTFALGSIVSYTGLHMLVIILLMAAGGFGLTILGKKLADINPFESILGV